jgi:hypothetical protein
MPIVAVFLGKDAVDDEEIAKDADAALRGRALTSDGGYVARPVADGAEDVKVDGGFESRGALMGLHHVEDKAGSERGFCAIRRWHGNLLGLARL